MSRNVSQKKIIDNLNQYLELTHAPSNLRLSETGVCCGLASVCAKYIIQGQQDAFFKLLEKVSEMDPKAGLNVEVDQFVMEIVLSHSPELFDVNEDCNQQNSLKTLYIEGEPLKSSFNLTMVTDDKNWSQIIKNLEIRDNEAVRISSLVHLVTVTKKNGVYTLYDPNYSSGYKIFFNESNLIQELHINVLHYNSQLGEVIKVFGMESLAGKITGALGINGSLGMLVQVIRHPTDKSPRDFPDVQDLYHKYLDTSDKLNQTAITRGIEVNNMIFAVQNHDKKAVNALTELS